MTALGLQPFLTYPAVIKLRHKGEQRSFDSPHLSVPCHRGRYMLRLYKATGKRRPSSLRPGGRGLKAGMEAIPTAGEKMVAGWRWILAKSFYFFFFLSPPGILFLFIRHNCLFAGKTNTLFSFWRGLMRVGLITIIYFARWAFRGTCLALKWTGHVSSLFFVAQSDLLSR